MGAAARTVQQSTALLFFLHSVLALYILLYYPSIMHTLYHAQGTSLAPFHIFAEILPGRLSFSAVTSQEPIYEAGGKIVFLQNIIILVSLLNLILNSFFIPFAGYYGAAFATSASMFAYFILFGRHLTSVFKTNKYIYIIVGSSVYLTYMLFQKLVLSFAVSFFLVPAFLFLLFIGIDIFNFNTWRIDSESNMVSAENTSIEEA